MQDDLPGLGDALGLWISSGMPELPLKRAPVRSVADDHERGRAIVVGGERVSDRLLGVDEARLSSSEL